MAALAGARVAYAQARGGGQDALETTSGLDGHFELPARVADAGTPRFACVEEGYATLLPGVESEGLWHVVVGRAARFSGVGVDEAQRPIEGFELQELAGGPNVVLQVSAYGGFELGGLLARDCELRAFHPASGTRGGPRRIAAGTRDLELVLEAEPGTRRAAGRVVTAGDTPLELLESFGAFLGAGKSAAFEEGKTSVLRVSELGRTVLLSMDGTEMLHRALSLDPTTRQELRF